MRKVILYTLLIVVFFSGWMVYQEWSWHSLPTARLELSPIDPYDVLRGRYFILNPTAENLSNSKNDGDKAILKEFYAEKGTNSIKDIYVVFEKNKSGVAQPVRITSEIPLLTSNQFALLSQDKYYPRRRYHYFKNDNLRLDFKLKRFYLPNRLELPAKENEKGWQVEVLLRPNHTAVPKTLWFKDKRVYPR